MKQKISQEQKITSQNFFKIQNQIFNHEPPFSEELSQAVFLLNQTIIDMKELEKLASIEIITKTVMDKSKSVINLIINDSTPPFNRCSYTVKGNQTINKS